MAKHPYAITLSDEHREELRIRFVEELRAGIRARSAHIDDNGLIDFYYALYEQQALKPISRTDPARNGEPDLTSPIGTENVDALSARTVQTIFRQEPVYMVDGDQQSAQRAPIVEAFLQMRQEQMRFQKTAKRAVTAAYVETGHVIEVCEDSEPVRRHQIVTAKVLRADDGSVLLGEDGKPLPETDERGVPIPAGDGDEATVEVMHAYTELRRAGAYPRTRSMKDFLVLPSHATDEREVWAHATRFYPRLDEIKRRYDAGEWGPKAGGCDWDRVKGDAVEREQRPEQDRAGISVETAHGAEDTNWSVEKELWRVQAFVQLPGQDELCCVQVIVSERLGEILALTYDWIGEFRTVYINPYPKPYSFYGYSLIEKLLTTIEEHTSMRNMNAWRTTLKSNTPLKRRRGTAWDPELQPFGAGKVIDLDNMEDVQPFAFDDVTVQAMQKEQQCVIDAQRIIGMNDIAIGQTSEKSRTLGENRMATSQSFVRTDDPISNIQEAFEEVGRVMHLIEVQALRDRGEPITAPAQVSERLQQQFPAFQGQFTPEMLDGTFTFKLRGSSDQADPNMRFRRMDMLLGAVERLAKAGNPYALQRLHSAELERAIMQSVVSETKPRDPGPLLMPIQLPMPTMGMGGPPGPGGPGAPMPPPGGQAPSFGGEVLNKLMAQMPQGGVQ